MKIHLGSGSRLLEGWLNIDEWEGYPNLPTDYYLRHDLRHPVPLPDSCADFVYSEHFIEHLDREEGQRMFSEMYRLLKPRGIVRVSAPNLAEVVDAYIHKDIKRFSNSWHPETPARMVNEGLTLWGHKFVYDEDEMRIALSTAGFLEIKTCSYGESDFKELCGLEHRPRQNDLIMEAKRI